MRASSGRLAICEVTLMSDERSHRRQIGVGEIWGYREKASNEGQRPVPVKVVKLSPPKLQKARIQYLDGELEGLEVWCRNVV
jgi:hypothetical protein